MKRPLQISLRVAVVVLSISVQAATSAQDYPQPRLPQGAGERPVGPATPATPSPRSYAPAGPSLTTPPAPPLYDPAARPLQGPSAPPLHDLAGPPLGDPGAPHGAPWEGELHLGDVHGVAPCNSWCGPPAPPPMIGDFFMNRTGGLRGGFIEDRLLVRVGDLTVPNPLPAGNLPLVLLEAGPVGVFATNVLSVQQAQALLRAGQPLPPGALVGTINQPGLLISSQSIAETQFILASTPGVAFDIVPIEPPPGVYAPEVAAAFAARRGPGRDVVYNGAISGALLEGGADALAPGVDLTAFYYYDYILRIDASSPSVGASGVGALKFAEGGSPIPQDRIFLHEGRFEDARFAPGGVTVTRFTPGFEKTFLGGELSVEMRFPFASTVDDTYFVGPGAVTNTNEAEFGNLATYVKWLLYYDEQVALSMGLGVTAPTADDVSVRLADGRELVRIVNDAAHVQPFIGAVYAPTPRLFAQAVVQYDFAAGGNPVELFNGTQLEEAGLLNDTMQLFLDGGVGYWVYRPDMFAETQISGVAAVAELHYNRALEDADVVSNGVFQLGDFASEVDVLNATVGTVIEIGATTTISAGYVTPIGNEPDQQFERGFRVMLDHYPGGRF